MSLNSNLKFLICSGLGGQLITTEEGVTECVKQKNE